MDYIERIQRAIDFIEEKISDDLSLNEIASIAKFSEYHFHRVFHVLVGITVMDYVKKRRLSIAAQDLLVGKRKIVDVAFNIGFNSHETFTRAFKKMFMVNPSEFRYCSDPTIIFNKVTLERLSISKFLGGIIMEPKIINHKKFMFIGYELKTTAINNQSFNDIPQFIRKYYDEKMGDKILHKFNSNINLKILTDFEKERHGNFTYLIGYETDTNEKVMDEQVVRTFLEQKFAVFTTPKVPKIEFSNTIQNTWRYIFQEWFPRGSYEHAGTYEIELYDERSKNMEEAEMDIYIPIR